MIFLLGGNGFVGSGFVHCLKKKKIKYKIITRENYKKFIGSSCDILINSNGNSKKYLALNNPKIDFYQSVTSVISSLVDFKFKKYVYLSSCDVYPDRSRHELTLEDSKIDLAKQSIYGFHKYLAELAVIKNSTDWLIIRQGGFVGPKIKKNTIYDVIYEDKLFVHPDSLFQFIHTHVSADLILQLIFSDISNEIFNLTGAGTLSVNEIMKILKKNIKYNGNERPIINNVSLTKISKLIKLPKTKETVKSFLSKSLVKTKLS